MYLSLSGSSLFAKDAKYIKGLDSDDMPSQRYAAFNLDLYFLYHLLYTLNFSPVTFFDRSLVY